MKSRNPFRVFGLWMTFRIKPFILPVGVIVLAVNLLYTGVLSKRKFDPKSAMVEQRLNELELQTRSTIRGWLDTPNPEKYLDTLWMNGPSASWEKQGMALLLFRDTSVVYWSQYPFSATGNECWRQPTGTLRKIGGQQLLTLNYQREGRSAVVIFTLQKEVDGPYNANIFPQQHIRLLTIDDTSAPDSQEVIAVGNRLRIEGQPRAGMPWWVEMAGWLAAILISLWIRNVMRRHTTRHNPFGQSLLLLLLLAGWRAALYFAGIPNPDGELFRHIYDSSLPLIGSLGDLLLSFSLIFIYVTYLYQIRHKLNWKYRKLPRPWRFVVGLVITSLTSLMVATFHCALILSIQSPKINVQLYDLFDLSLNSGMFYLLAVVFFSCRMLITQIDLKMVSIRHFILRASYSCGFILLVLAPFEEQINYTGYISVIFYVIYLAVDFLRKHYRNYGSFIISLGLFSAYITFFATVEDANSQNDSQVVYARILATSPQDQLVDDDEDEISQSTERFNNFTYARISNHQVLFKYNNNNDYQDLLAQIIKGNDTTLSQNGHIHFVYHYYDPGHTPGILVVSRRETNLLDAAALFTYAFLILFLMCGLLLEMGGFTFNIQRFSTRVTFRVRGVVIGIVIFAMAAVTVAIVRYIRHNVQRDIRQLVNNHIQWLSVSLNQYLAHNPADAAHIQEWMTGEQSEARFTISVYTPQGELLVSSITAPASIPRMGSTAYLRLHYLRHPFYVNDSENHRYIASYMPVMRYGQLIGYLGTRYENPSKEIGLLRHQLLLTDILNIFLIILFFAIILSEILYRFLAKPFNQLHEAMGNIAQMKKIDAVRPSQRISDEIGMLVEQYNRMIDYLHESYERVAQSEREGAWREMARQVAHEIKNPLTPMRLRIQMLQRVMKQEDCHDLRPQVEGTLALLLEQIELLNKIASEFSDFAKLGEGNPQRIDLVPLVCNVVKLYSGYDNIGIRFHYPGCTCNDPNQEVGSMLQHGASVPIPTAEEALSVWVDADADHLARVFVNICQNAVQAIGSQPEGWIDIDLMIRHGKVRITFRDNGPGIPIQIQSRLFRPNFTTKSSGSGLGLALSRKIVELLGGTINFESEQGYGAAFTVTLPLSLESGEGEAAPKEEDTAEGDSSL